MSAPLSELVAHRVRERPATDFAHALRTHETGDEPLVIRGAVKDWPATQKALHSPRAFNDYLLRFDSGVPVAVFSGAPELEGRIFYNDDFSGLNCARRQSVLSTVLDTIIAADPHNPPLIYVGSTPVASHLPGFERDNRYCAIDDSARSYLWIGGPSRISAHYDFSENLACVVAGRREFILFPPQQVRNLYIGPLDYSPAGQPISLVDFHKPDFNAFPRFREALSDAQSAELYPGDAIFIPGMWWHHVEAFDSINVLVNYWWRRPPGFLGAPENVLEHAMMTLRDLPAEQKAAWRDMFSHYVFDNGEETIAHIPAQVRGILDPVKPEDVSRIRASLFDRLNA